ncbi:MAG TPA: hypothetical protein VFH77_06095 [Streptomyces sp.]|nr:hypothetical protein [Streptomyces sp.]
MQSIRTYTGEIRICPSCAQPCYLCESEYGPAWEHFIEQWDGVMCPAFPFASHTEPIVIDWDPSSLDTLKEYYPDSSESAFPSRAKRA